VRIESHDDDSVTVTAGSVTAHIRGDSWTDANMAAHALGAFLEARREVNALIRKLNGLREQARRVDSAEHEVGVLLDWLDIPTEHRTKIESDDDP